MHDGDPCPKAKSICLDTVTHKINIEKKGWPGKFSNINAIEDVWELLQHEIVKNCC